MSDFTQSCLSPLRRCIRLLRTQRSKVPLAVKVALAALMLVPFSIIVVVLRIVAAARGAIEVEAETDWGGRLLCRPPDLIGLYIWLFGVWEPDLTRFIESRLREGDGFIDVGANLGYYSILAARCVGRSGHVVAVEASPAVFNTLQENLARNDVAQSVRALNMAAASTAAVVNVYGGPAHNMGLTTTVKERGMKLQAQVAAQPLDAMLHPAEIRSARIVKIDVEGAELEVLAGMRGVLEECRADVEFLIELSPTWWSDQSKMPADALRPFLEAGFNVYSIPNNYWPWRYLWPRSVAKPRRVGPETWDRRINRLDLVLSRVDADVL